MLKFVKFEFSRFKAVVRTEAETEVKNSKKQPYGGITNHDHKDCLT